jgi:hypothetical protein
MFKSKAKQRAHEAFMARQTFKSKAQKRADFRSRNVLKQAINTRKSETFTVCSTDKITHCEPHMPKGTFAGTVMFMGRSHKTYIPFSHLNAKKAKSVADPCQSWIAHW